VVQNHKTIENNKTIRKESKD